MKAAALVRGMIAASMVSGACGSGAGSDGGAGGSGGSGPASQILFVGFNNGTLASYDVASGQERAGTLTNVRGPTDMQALADGHVLVNLTETNEILIFDGRTMHETARIPSSTIGGTHPVHTYVTPTIDATLFEVSNNDGDPGMLQTNTVRIVDLTPGSPTYLTGVGELALAGIGHHKNAFSTTKRRVSISNIADCNVVLQVADYTNPQAPALIKTFGPADVDPTKDCAAQGASPHGAAFSSAGGRGYHNFTGWGAMIAVDQDVDPPTVTVLPTTGSGAGYTAAGRDGRYVYSLQNRPREADATKPGSDCQIGQLVVVDGVVNAVVKEVPVLYEGTGCTDKIAGTPAATTSPDTIQVSLDGHTLFVSSQGTPPAGSVDPWYSEQELVFDISDGANPVQQASIKIGRHSGHRRQVLSGDGALLFVVNGNDNTVSQIDVASRTTRSIAVKARPVQIATWGAAEGASIQIGP